MNHPDRLERDLTVWFGETAAPRTPPYLDDILRQTAQLRQRPRWTFFERLIPMTATTSFRAVTGNVPWRTVGALALLILVLVVGALLVGSTQGRLPAPFGPAAAGLVAYASEGDIVVVDPATGQKRAIVTGDTDDREPQWSRDGTRIVFARHEAGLSRLFTVRADGSGLTPIMPGPISLLDDATGPDYAFSPDGRSVLFVSSASIQIAQSDGSGVRTLTTSFVPVEVAWRPVVGAQVGAIGLGGGVYLVDVADGEVQTLVPPAVGVEAAGLAWSPDGSRLAYHPWTDAADFTVRSHIVDVDSGQDRPADPRGADAAWDGGATWSNDGQRLVIVRGYSRTGYEDVTAAIIRADGTGSRVETAHGLVLIGQCCATFDWAPDDSSILWNPIDAGGGRHGQLLLDPNTGAVTPAPWQAVGDPAWQRRAR